MIYFVIPPSRGIEIIQIFARHYSRTKLRQLFSIYLIFTLDKSRLSLSHCCFSSVTHHSTIYPVSLPFGSKTCAPSPLIYNGFPSKDGTTANRFPRYSDQSLFPRASFSLGSVEVVSIRGRDRATISLIGQSYWQKNSSSEV